MTTRYVFGLAEAIVGRRNIAYAPVNVIRDLVIVDAFACLLSVVSGLCAITVRHPSILLQAIHKAPPRPQREQEIARDHFNGEGMPRQARRWPEKPDQIPNHRLFPIDTMRRLGAALAAALMRAQCLCGALRDVAAGPQ